MIIREILIELACLIVSNLCEMIHLKFTMLCCIELFYDSYA